MKEEDTILIKECTNPDCNKTSDCEICNGDGFIPVIENPLKKKVINEINRRLDNIKGHSDPVVVGYEEGLKEIREYIENSNI